MELNSERTAPRYFGRTENTYQELHCDVVFVLGDGENLAALVRF